MHKVEIIDQRNWAHYYFNCDRWLAKNEDDGKVERVLDVWKGDLPSSRNSKLEIKVKHFGDPESDAELPPPVVVKEKTPSPSKSSRKVSVTSQASISSVNKQKMKTPEPPPPKSEGIKFEYFNFL